MTSPFQLATVKNVLIEEMPVPSAYAGDHASLVLNGLEQYNVSNGMVACDPSQPIAVTKKIQARIVVFTVDLPITKGFPVVFHYGSVQVSKGQRDSSPCLVKSKAKA